MINLCLLHRVGAGGQPAHTPLRTVRESFPSYGSSLSKDAPARGTPAIVGNNVSIRSPLYACRKALTSPSAR